MKEKTAKNIDVLSYIIACSAYDPGYGATFEMIKSEFPDWGGARPKRTLSQLVNYELGKEEIYDFAVYCFTDKGNEKKKKDIPFDELLEEDDFISIDGAEDTGEYQEKSLTDRDGSPVYIRIIDNIKRIREKLDEDNIDITSASAYVFKEWSDWSRIRLIPDYVIDKSLMNVRVSAEQKKKMIDMWEYAIWSRHRIITINGKIENEVYPLGLYYNRLNDGYTVVYANSETELRDKEWEYYYIEDFEGFRLTNHTFTDEEFTLDEFWKKYHQCKVVLKLYKAEAANVKDKLKHLLQDHSAVFSEDDESYRIEFLALDEYECDGLIKMYGRSIIVLEPEELRDQVKESIENALDNYISIPGNI